MSVFNHLGKLVSVDGEWATYEYYPDYIACKLEFGIFKVKPASLLIDGATEYEILNRCAYIKLWCNRSDEYVILALIRKIRESAKAGNLFPEKVYYHA